MKKITDIQTQKRNQDRVSIYIDHVFYLGISRYVCEKYKLKIGSTYDEKRIDEALREESFETAKNYVTKYLVGKPEKVIRDKMTLKEYDPDTIEKTIDFMKKYGFINDEQYAKAFTHDAHKIKRQGKRKIQQLLKQKGISNELIQQALIEIEDEDQIKAATHKLKLKLDGYKKKAKSPYELKSKCYGYLMQNGFESDVIQIAIKNVIIE